MDNKQTMSPAKAWLQFAIVFFAGITIAMGMFKVPVNMPNIMNFYGTDMTTVSWMMSIVGISCLVTALPAGGIMQKVGVKTFGIIVIVCGILECLLGAVAPSIELLIASRVLDAVSYGCLTMVSVAIISASFAPEQRGLPNGIWVIWVPVAQLLVAQIANGVVPAFGWQGEWIVVGVCQIIALVLFILFIKNPGQQAADADGADEPEEKASIVDGLKEPGPWLLTLICGGLAFGCSVYTGLYPAYLSSPMGAGLDPADANNLVSLGSLGGIVGSVLIGIIINIVKPTKRGWLMLAICAVSIVTFLVVFSVPAAIMAIFIIWYSFVSTINMPVAFAWVPDILKNPKTLSMAMGIMMIGANIGGALGVTLPSALIDGAGGVWAACLPLIVGLAIVSLVLTVVLTLYVKKKVLPVRPDLEGK